MVKPTGTPPETKQTVILGTITVNPDMANSQTGEFVQAAKLETTKNTDIDN